jgi:hypothetical protein
MHAGKTVMHAKIEVAVWSMGSFAVKKKRATGQPKNGSTPSAAQTPKTVLLHII